MQDLYLEEAFAYYDKHINRTERFDLLEAYHLPVPGSVPPIDWELFGAIMTGSKGTPGYGADLENYEVKSAIEGNSFEYQYHLHGGLTKLEEDIVVQHIFISYSRDYLNVTVRIVPGQVLAAIFEAWRPKLLENYTGENPRQRFRRSISFGTVKKEGVVVMEIKHGQRVV